MEILKYPIGKFSEPVTSNTSDRMSWIKILGRFPQQLKALTENWSKEQLDTPYREGAWTVRQLIHHIADSHMNSLIRFKLGMTEDTPTIKAYDQKAWAELPDSKEVPADVSIKIIEGIHKRFVVLLETMSTEDFQKEIYHPEMKRKISLNNMLALYAWHSEHHLAQIEQLKRQKNW